MRCLSCADVSLLCISLVIPPAGVFAKKGCSHETGLSVMLSLLFYFPGVIYAFAIILSKKKQKTEKATMMKPLGQHHMVSVDSDEQSSSCEVVVDN